MTRAPDALGPLTPDDIEFLALEGGGGKGVAFLGAIEALESLDVLRHVIGPSADVPSGHLRWLVDSGIDPGRRLADAANVRGIAGASAGAITALMLSCGYGAADIRTILATFDFDTFFETPRPRRAPRVSGVLDPHDREAAVEVADDDAPSTIDAALELIDAVLGRRLGPKIGLAADVWRRVLIAAAPSVIRAVADSYDVSLPRAAEVVLDHFDEFVEFLPRDMGLFPGYTARAFFADLLAFKLPLRNGKLQYNATFADHYDWFRIELAITGTNVESGKSGIFSHRTTPNFPIADAVRISMSLPFAYKPYVIRREHYEPLDLPSWVDGVWIDGGYLNNLPLHVFDQDGGVRRTLGLRLEIDEAPKPVEDFGDFLGRWPLAFGFLGAGEGHVGPATRNDSQTIVLDTAGLDLLRFSYPTETVDEVSARTRRQVFGYFDGL